METLAQDYLNKQAAHQWLLFYNPLTKQLEYGA